jgi:RNA polymerase sigma factor (TIGR02999 family)
LKKDRTLPEDAALFRRPGVGTDHSELYFAARASCQAREHPAASAPFSGARPRAGAPDMSESGSLSQLTLLLNARTTTEGLGDEELLPLVYDELRRIAARQMAGEAHDSTLQPTALVHEAWLRLSSSPGRRWKDRLHFFRTAVRTMRRVLVDRARRRSTLRHADPRQRVDIADLELAAEAPDDCLLRVDAALRELERTDPASARLVDLKFFGGFTNSEIAWMNGVAERTVDRRWVYARACLYQIMQADAG